MSEPNPMQKLVAGLNARIVDTLHAGADTASVLEWLKDQPSELVTEAIAQTQPGAWRVAIEPLIKSLSEDQLRGFLAALIAVFAQTLPATK